jgi:hypothetical protein
MLMAAPVGVDQGAVAPIGSTLERSATGVPHTEQERVG